MKGEPVRFTSWGIVSGIFWVPGGWAGIYGIRTAGLAVAAGTWSSMIVLTSFFWGIFVFEEKVKSKLGACCACCTLIVGLIGMSMFSRPRAKRRDVEQVGDEKGMQKKRESITLDEEDIEGMRKRIYSSKDLKAAISNKGSSSDFETASKRGVAKKVSEKKVKTDAKTAPSSLPLTALEMESLIEKDTFHIIKHHATPEMKRISIFGGHLTKRQLGLTGALFNGLWGGTNMIPLHYAAREGYGGPSYVISFSCGSLIVTIALWAMRFLYKLYRHDGDVTKAYRALPPFHVREMWLLGSISGLIYSCGNFMCIIAVTYLGQGVGYSFTQSSMLISGLW